MTIPLTVRHIRFAMLCLVVALLMPFTASAEVNTRSCTVREVITGGMYVYLRCDEKGADVWLATVAREFKTGEPITFLDVPPVNNFYSKQLDRIFPEVIFTDFLPPQPAGK